MIEALQEMAVPLAGFTAATGAAGALLTLRLRALRARRRRHDRLEWATTSPRWDR